MGTNEALPKIELGAIWLHRASGRRVVVNGFDGTSTFKSGGLTPDLEGRVSLLGEDDRLTIVDTANILADFVPIPERGQRWRSKHTHSVVEVLVVQQDLVGYDVLSPDRGRRGSATLHDFVDWFVCVPDADAGYVGPRVDRIRPEQFQNNTFVSARLIDKAVAERLAPSRPGVIATNAASDIAEHERQLGERFEAWRGQAAARFTAAASGLLVDVGAVWVDRKTGERWTVESYAPGGGVCGVVVLRRGEATATVDMRHTRELYAPATDCERCGAVPGGGKHCAECERLERALADLRRVEWRIEIPLHDHDCSECRGALPKNQAAIFRIDTVRPGGGGAFKAQCWPCAAKAKVDHERVLKDVKWALARRAEMKPTLRAIGGEDGGLYQPKEPLEEFEGLEIPTLGRIGALRR